jgi:hypothetical protein
MLVTGEYIDADKALDWGLVNKVCDHEKLDEEVLRLVTEIIKNPAVAITMGKRLFYSQLEKSSIAGACKDLFDGRKRVTERTGGVGGIEGKTLLGLTFFIYILIFIFLLFLLIPPDTPLHYQTTWPIM